MAINFPIYMPAIHEFVVVMVMMVQAGEFHHIVHISVCIIQLYLLIIRYT